MGTVSLYLLVLLIRLPLLLRPLTGLRVDWELSTRLTSSEGCQTVAHRLSKSGVPHFVPWDWALLW